MPIDSIFHALSLSPDCVATAQSLGYTTPTPIQIDAIPVILEGRDLIASAPTGSGKTLAYCLPLIDLICASSTNSKRDPRALILVPTRELASQVGDVLIELVKNLSNQKIKVSVAFGGVSINPQMMQLRGGSDIVVATPGRLLDLLASNALQLSDIRTLVLDEADRLLDCGFADELDLILTHLPAQRQNIFLSATFPDTLKNLGAKQLNNAIELLASRPTDQSVQIDQRAIEVDAEKRTQLLIHLFKTSGWDRALVFVATKYASGHIAEKCNRAGLVALAFNGDMSQGARSDALSALKASKVQIVVTTDLASRGIDVDDLPVVVNYDLPRSADDYTHRIGRTGRAGRTGVAISFVNPLTQAHFKLIEKRQGCTITRQRVAGFEPSNSATVVQQPSGGLKGKRPNKKDKLRALLAPDQQ